MTATGRVRATGTLGNMDRTEVAAALCEIPKYLREHPDTSLSTRLRVDPQPALRLSIIRMSTLVWISLCLLASTPSCADGFHLLSVGIRARLANERVLGRVQPEAFQEYDAVANIGLPWAWYSQSRWGLGTRLLISAGVLRGAGKTALVTSLVPEFALGRQDGRFALELGSGVALLSERRFGAQDYGGPLQFALTIGLGFPLYKNFGLAYRYLHYSAARIYGPNKIGSDFHMLELTYWY